MITQKDKKAIWAELNLSGSKFKKWCLQPDKFVLNEETTFPEFMREKIDFGNKLEDFIFDTAKNSKKKYNFIKDKNTYQHDVYDFCFANVDGFFISDNEKGILEIKNTETTNIDKLIDTYKYQVLYYCWFFDLKKVMFAFLINGCRFRTAEFTFSDEDLKFASNRVIEFKEYLETKKIPEIKKLIIEKKDKDEIDNIVKEYDEKYNIFQELKGEMEVLETKIKDHCEKTQSKLESEKFIFEIQKQSRTTLDKSKVQKYTESNNIDYSQFEKTAEISILKKIKKD